MKHLYILDKNGKPRSELNLFKWAEWFEDFENRMVKQSFIGELCVSTVFLALDHRVGKKGPPILWETIVFSPQGNELDCDRCSGNREQAEAMHELMLLKWTKMLSST